MMRGNRGSVIEEGGYGQRATKKTKASKKRKGDYNISSAPFPSQIVVFANEVKESTIKLLNKYGKVIMLK